MIPYQALKVKTQIKDLHITCETGDSAGLVIQQEGKHTDKLSIVFIVRDRTVKDNH